MKNDIEKRTLAECELRVVSEGDTKKITGYVVKWDKYSEDMGGWKERVAKGAFTNTLANGPDVVSLFNHDAACVLGRRSAGTMSITEDDTGLLIEVTPPDTQVGRDVMASIKRGDVTGQSFMFRTITDAWETRDDTEVRTLKEVELREAGPVVFPAYPDSQVALRSRDEWKEQQKPKVDKEKLKRQVRLAEIE